jgi:hypothetical protein
MSLFFDEENFFDELDKITENPEVELWTTTDGKQIPINKLTDGHLLNILKLAHRQGPAHLFALESALSEHLSKAYYHLEDRLGTLEDRLAKVEEEIAEWDVKDDPLYQKVYAEAERRGIVHVLEALLLNEE